MASTDTTVPQIIFPFAAFIVLGAGVIFVDIVLVESATAKLQATRPAIRAWYNFIQTSLELSGEGMILEEAIRLFKIYG